MRPRARRNFNVNIDILTGTAAYANVVPVKAGYLTYLTRIELSVTTHAADVYSVDDDGAGPVIASHTDAAAGAGVPSVVEWNFGTDGRLVTSGANVDVAHSSTGVAVMKIEGYYQRIQATLISRLDPTHIAVH